MAYFPVLLDVLTLLPLASPTGVTILCRLLGSINFSLSYVNTFFLCFFFSTLSLYRLFLTGLLFSMELLFCCSEHQCYISKLPPRIILGGDGRCLSSSAFSISFSRDCKVQSTLGFATSPRHRGRGRKIQ